MVLYFCARFGPWPVLMSAIFFFCPLAVIGCIYLLLFLPTDAKLVYPVWAGIGLVFYFLYGYRKSHVALGICASAGGENIINPLRSLVDSDDKSSTPK